MPDLLIVSESAGAGVDRIDTAQMTQAVKPALKYHFGFRAGRFSVSYQVSKARPALQRVAGVHGVRHARGPHARNRMSGRRDRHAGLSVREGRGLSERRASRAHAVVSPMNTYPGLTRSVPGTALDEPERYAGSGTSSYARVALTDDAQGRATVRLLEEPGAHEPFVVQLVLMRQPWQAGSRPWPSGA